ncbi:Chordopoxvirus fusion protein [Candidatus Magnetomoraceae bacterium gMMP-15]
MQFSVTLMRKMDNINIDPELKDVLWTMFEELEKSRQESVTKIEFIELKEIVKDLAINQQELAEAQKELTQAQKETKQSIKELSEAQKETKQSIKELSDDQKKIKESIRELSQVTKQSIKELTEDQKEVKQSIKELSQETKQSIKELSQETKQSIKELSQAQKELTDAQKQTEKEVAKLARGLKATRSQVGGLSKSVAYALENEAFQKIPKYLKNHFQLEIKEHFVRSYIGGEEINLFAKAKQNGEDVLIVGESVLKLDDRSKMKQLKKNVEAVKRHYDYPIIPLLITHFGRPDILEKAREEGIIIVQSFEWI